jgi:hypothetical protein
MMKSTMLANLLFSTGLSIALYADRLTNEGKLREIGMQKIAAHLRLLGAT